jgi:menaquinol-cytochrome c reductase iron-sulfur subunit
MVGMVCGSDSATAFVVLLIGLTPIPREVPFWRMKQESGQWLCGIAAGGKLKSAFNAGRAFRFAFLRELFDCPRSLISMAMHSADTEARTGRRGFIKKSLAALLGAIAAVVPLAAGLMVATDPLRRRAAGGAPVKVTTLDALPADGVPRRFPVIAAKTDAWNRFEAAPVGAVYLRRTADGSVAALNVVCPHAGCFVDFVAGSGKFHCPCHQSSFATDGKISDARSPSPRGLDSLAVEVKPDGSVWVAFQNFEAGRPDKVPVA